MLGLNAYLQTLHDLHGSHECVLVGLGLELPKLLLEMDFKKIVVAEADLREIEKISKVYDFSERFLVTDELIFKDDVETSFEIASNPSANTFEDIEKFRELYPNIELMQTLEKPSISLDTFVSQCDLKNAKWLILNTLNSKAILEQNDLKKFDVIMCKIEKSELSEIQAILEEDNFKHVRYFEKQNPKILWSIFVKDTQKLTTQKSQELQEKLKQATDEKELIAKQLQEEQIKVKELTENFSKSKEELEALKKLTTQKSQELQEKLKQATDEKELIAKQLQEEQIKVKELTENFSKSKEELEALKKLTTQKSQELQEKLKQATDEKDKIIEDLLLSKKRTIPKSYLSTIDKDKKIDFISSYCLMQDDILDTIDSFVLDSELNENEKFDLCCAFSLKIAENGDKHQGINFLNNARYFLDKENDKEQYKKLIEIASSLDSVALAVDLEMEFNAKYGVFSSEINKKIADEYKKIRSVSLKKQAHGHDLLIDYIEKNVKDDDQTGKILVEIGTTRENIPGQGSTMQLAQLCKRKNIRFITVDMDPHNSKWATFISHKYNLNITAITKKGEDFLRDDIESFDFVFLDAYDFDHGMHSELRQSRYEKNLGSKIDEEACHLMHLDCAKSVVEKLKKDGVVCVDDTWKNEYGKWTAKGTLAIPYFMSNAFQLIEQKNKALIIKRTNNAKNR